MTVRENIAFGLELLESRTQRTRRGRGETLQLEPYLKREPGALSGGQRPRVAMGRAIARNSSIVLIDEPLSDLDNALQVTTNRGAGSAARLKDRLRHP